MSTRRQKVRERKSYNRTRRWLQSKGHRVLVPWREEMKMRSIDSQLNSIKMPLVDVLVACVTGLSEGFRQASARSPGEW